MRGSGLIGLAAVGAALGRAHPAAAQHGLWPEPTLSGLRRVESGVADAGPLSTSQRVLPVDLRAPTGFEGVYEFDRAGPWGTTETMFMRTSGGLSAVFPRSVYVPAPGGLVPEIPAGTVFVIGSPWASWGADRGRRGAPRSPLAVDMSVRQAPTPAPLVHPPAASAAYERRTIWNNETFRRQRVEQLLEPLAAPPPR